MKQAIIVVGGYNSLWPAYLKMARDLEDLTGLQAIGVPLWPWHWWAAGQAQDASNILQKAHLFSSLISLYVTMRIVVWGLENSVWLKSWSISDLSLVVFVANLLITSLWGLRVVKAKLWFTKLYEDLARSQNYSYSN